MTASEMLYENQKNQFKKVFDAPIINFYGHTERAVLAGYCEYIDTFHIYPQYGYVELLDSGGCEVSQGERGEIIGTGFLNYITPFVRYRTYDYATKGPDFCSYCKRNYKQFMSIDGRYHDFVLTKSKKRISLVSIPYSSLIKDYVSQFQFVQSKIGQIEISFVRNENTTEDRLRNIVEQLTIFLNKDVIITLKEVKSIKRAANGKFKILDQSINGD